MAIAASSLAALLECVPLAGPEHGSPEQHRQDMHNIVTEISPPTVRAIQQRHETRGLAVPDVKDIRE